MSADLAALNPLFYPSVDPASKLWDFPWTGMHHDGTGASCQANHRPNPQAPWTTVGEIDLLFRLGKGGSFLDDRLVFTAGADSMTFHLADLMSKFSKGAVVQLFKNWYDQITGDGLSGSVYNQNGVLLGTGHNGKNLTTSDLTVFSAGHGDGVPMPTYQWGDTWGSSPDVSGSCVLAIGMYVIAVNICAAFAVGAVGGPEEWWLFFGSAALMLASAANVANTCGL